MIRRVKQNEEKDCGAACFATIVNLNGGHLSLAESRELTHSNATGTTIQGIIYAGNKVGLSASGLEGSFGELKNGLAKKEIELPCIALVVIEEGLGHFLVIEDVDSSSMTIFDPAKGKRKISYKDFENIWSGYLVTFKPEKHFIKRTVKFSSTYYNNLLKKEWKLLTLVLVFSIVISLFTFLGSFSYQRIIDAFILKSESAVHEDHAHTFFEEILHTIIYNLNYLVIAVVCLYLLQAVLSIVRSIFIAHVSKKMNDDLFAVFFEKILFMKTASLKNRDSGELMTRYNIATQVQQILTRLILSIFLEVFVAVTGGIILYSVSSKLFLITTLILLGYLVISLIFIKPLNKVNTEAIEKNAKSITQLSEVLSGFEAIKLGQNENLFFDKLMIRVKEFTSVGKLSVIFQSIQSSLTAVLESLGTVIILWQGSYLVVGDKLTLGSLIAFVSLLTFFTSPIRNIIDFQREIQNVLVMIRKLGDIMESSEEDLGEDSYSNKKLKEIKLQDIIFSYGADKKIIDNFSADFQTGKSYLIKGKSGSGKTTLMNIISSLYTPDAGMVLLDGKDMNERKQAYRREVAYVSNNPFLMFGTIQENLFLEIEDVDENYFEEILKYTGINKMLNEFPEGLDTIVLENGQNLSSGQRQRISIARALLKKPSILLLDEALSNLDKESKKSILKYINEELKSIMRIYVSHDGVLDSEVDKIVLLNYGG